jgi:general stress protein CsbA
MAILALALATPVWMVVLVSTITTRRQAVSLALALPALAASAMVGA